jgi:hypothetical protein
MMLATQWISWIFTERARVSFLSTVSIQRFIAIHLFGYRDVERDAGGRRNESASGASELQRHGGQLDLVIARKLVRRIRFA